MKEATQSMMQNSQEMIKSLEEKVKHLEEQLKNVSLGKPKESKNDSADQGREKTRMTKSSGKDISDSEGRIGGPFEITENPKFLIDRLQCFEKLYQKYESDLAAKPKVDIVITLPDGTEKLGKAWETSPLDIAKSISESLAKNCIVAKVVYSRRLGEKVALGGHMDEFEGLEEQLAAAKGELWDLSRPLEGDCKLHLLKFDDPEAKMVFWHSAAHLMGECLECKLGAHLTVGPPVYPGFYYDSYIGHHGITESVLKELETQVVKTAKQKQVFQRLVLSKEEALEMFAYNPYKRSIISNKVADGSMTCVYRNGPFVDLCLGPHIVDTGMIKAVELRQATTAYWLGKEGNDALQRVHGIAFPDKKLLKEHKLLVKLAEENDHRKKGTEQQLFFFNPLSPGSCFWEPHGAIIFNKLVNWMRKENRSRGYREVVSPNIYSIDLWKISGHWTHYKDGMFTFTDGEHENSIYGMKPMNCPGHCLIFDNQTRSYRDLPLRMADFGVLHRNEASGALTGLTRVRRFQQDDAHIFCRRDQVATEVVSTLNYVKSVYKTLGLSLEVMRSTRPAKAVGLVTDEGLPDPEGVALWDAAEEQLAQALDEFVGKGNWKDDVGGGAFYGPKIDIKIFDALKRKHQCATVQLDFQMPKRFKLKFTSEKANEGDGSKLEQPVMIHRAVLGSIERMTGILTEHFAGRWPFWLSPRQIMVIPIAAGLNDYAMELKDLLFSEGFEAEVDVSTKTLNKKILLAQKEQFNFMFVVGAQEQQNRSVNIRTRRNGKLGEMGVQEMLKMLHKFNDDKSLDDVVDPESDSARE